jgi:hypothetical protein
MGDPEPAQPTTRQPRPENPTLENSTMKTRILTTCCLALVAIAATRADEPKDVAKDAKKPRLEVCFVLDTTGSMSGLIEGAKEKIWSIANEMIAAKPTPELKLALIGYRDRGDEYVTKLTDLTADIDAIHGKLMEFSANGGGDGPESVNQALHEAVTKVSVVGGVPAALGAPSPVISGNGQYVAFESTSPDLAGDADGNGEGGLVLPVSEVLDRADGARRGDELQRLARLALAVGVVDRDLEGDHCARRGVGRVRGELEGRGGAGGAHRRAFFFCRRRQRLYGRA